MGWSINIKSTSGIIAQVGNIQSAWSPEISFDFENLKRFSLLGESERKLSLDEYRQAYDLFHFIQVEIVIYREALYHQKEMQEMLSRIPSLITNPYANDREIAILKEWQDLAVQSIKSAQGSRLRRIKEYIKRRKWRSEIGSIYLLTDGDIYKIGKSKVPQLRFQQIKSGYGKPLSMVFHHEVKRFHIVETDLHKKFKKKNVRGEWFRLTDNDVKSIKNYLSKHRVAA